MIHKTTDQDIQNKIDDLLREQARWEAAMRGSDALATDNAAERGDKILDTLAGTEAGKIALEELLSCSSPGLRLGVAATVRRWNPEKAVPVLAQLMHEALDPNVAPWEDAGIRMNARIVLMDQFGLRLDDTIALAGKLAEMGISLPDWLERQLRRE